MTYLGLTNLGGKNKKNTQGKQEGASRPRANTAPFGRGDQPRRRGLGRLGADAPVVVDPETSMVSQIDQFVVEGRQKELVNIFQDPETVPSRVGDWELRVNVRKQDNVPVSHTVVAIPLTVRTRGLFEEGGLATLRNAGFCEEDALRYFKAAWKKKYVWVDSVIAAVKEMVDAFQNTNVLDAYAEAGDPRGLARTNKVPINPYLTSHSHFLVAVEMAKCVINARNADVVEQQPTTDDVEPEAPAVTTNGMVMA